ncbi:autotransporter-associated beta strand repeat-containing protein, partial [Roseicyclus sp. F158]
MRTVNQAGLPLGARLLITTLLASGALAIGTHGAVSQSLTRVVDGKVVSAQDADLRGNGASGYEVLSGSRTIDGNGGTFSGYKTVGGAGSGGGAGLGGVFFVNSDATLKISNANFTGNQVVGGEGGGGGSVDVKNAVLAIGDKTTNGTSNLVAGFTSNVRQTADGFVLEGVDYGDTEPLYDVIDGATFGADVSRDGAVTTVTDTISSSNETGFTFANGLNIDDFVKSAAITDALSDSGVYALDERVEPTEAGFSRTFATEFSVENLDDLAKTGLRIGAQVVGSGVPAGTKITAITRTDGKITSVTLSEEVEPDVMDGFNVYTPPILTGSTFRKSGNTLTYAPGTVPTTLEVGMQVTGDGVTNENLTVTGIDRETGEVTLSGSLPSGVLTFNATKAGSKAGSNVIFAPSSSTGLSVGDAVYGDGIPSGTTVTAVEGDRIVLSKTLTAEVDILRSRNISASGRTATIGSGVEGIEVGQVVEGEGVPAGTTVVSVNATTGEVTLSNDIGSAIDSLRFVSDSAFGGGMNGRGVTNLGGSGKSGNSGRQALLNDGDGGDGQAGTSGASATNGTGGVGGKGGDGANGIATNPSLIADAASAALDLAGAIADATAASVPDPYPKPTSGAASAAQAIKLGIEVSRVAAEITKWQTDAGKGLTGIGGDGGAGGDGGDGSAFFGGGAGGAGGEAGEAALNSLGNGTDGAAGDGGDGGFGGGGGSGGQPANSASKDAAGEGGSGGFGAGQGSTVTAGGSTEGGQGGSGFGGAIFVRTGGTLILSGEMRFAGNTARGGSSADSSGGASGNGAGSDLFIMRGSDVSLSADAGKKIVFDGSIADDSEATYEGAQYASGDGADLTINGEGTVVFNRANTYTGDTILRGGMLEAQDGVGVHENSRIVFDGAASSDLSELSVPVLMSSGTFTRWVGSASDQVLWQGSGGFAAKDATGLTVNLGQSSSGNQELVWGQNGFVSDGSSLVLGSVTAGGTVTLVNDISHDDTQDGEVAFYLVDNTSSDADKSVLQGDVTAGTMSVDGNVRTALMQVEGTLDVASLDIAGGTVETTESGSLAERTDIDISKGARFIAGTEDTTGAVTNAGTYTVTAKQSVVSLTNEGLAQVGATLTARSGGVTNTSGATLDQRANITSEGDVTNDGTLKVTGVRRIETTGEASGLTGEGGIELAAEEDGLIVDQLGETTFSGVISGEGAFQKEGTGTLNLAGASTHTGGTLVAEGTLDTSAGGTLADSGAISISEDATFVAGTADTVGTVTNSGTYDVNAAQTVASLGNEGLVTLDANLTAGADGVFNDAAGTIEQRANITSEGSVTNNGDLEVTGDRLIKTTGEASGFMGLETGVVTLAEKDDSLTVEQLGNTAYAGTIEGLGSFTKDGTGWLDLTGANSFEGGTTVDVGTLRTVDGGTLFDTGVIDIREQGRFIAASADTVGVVTNAGTYSVLAAQNVLSLKNDGTAEIYAELTARAGGVTNTSGATLDQRANIISEGDVTNDGTLKVTGVRRIETTGEASGLTGEGGIELAAEEDGLIVDQLGETTFSGVISGEGVFQKEGTGTLNLAGASTHTGGTLVAEGTLDTSAGGTLADSGAISISEDATFVAGTADTVGTVTNSGTYDVNAAQNVASLGNEGLVTLDANLTAGADGVFNDAAGTIEQRADITSEGSVTNNGDLEVTGDRLIKTTGEA